LQQPEIEVLQLRAAGVSLVFVKTQETLEPIYWGVDIGSTLALEDLLNAVLEPAAHAELDAPIAVGVWRENSRGHLGKPALIGHRAGQDWSTRFALSSVESNESELTAEFVDRQSELAASVHYLLTPAGVLEVSASILNVGGSSYSLEDLSVWLPLPDHAAESIDYTGRWVKERQPQRREIQVGLWSREVREGRSGHDYTIAQLATGKGADYQSGEVWSLALMFSGNSRHSIERLPIGRTAIAAGELLLPGEVTLAPGETYRAPKVAAVYSANGIDGVSDRYYSWLRARPEHPTSPRPLTLNVWEAVYFDHDLKKLTALADVAQQIGVERFVLDDGWFGSRRDDTSGLGDWVVSREVWPDGLKPLIDVVKSRGMQFGLWFEGEMVNPDSELYRQHPDWILKIGDRVPPEGRRQLVLDFTNPAAYADIFAAVDAVLTEYDIDYIKWDHNKYLLEPGHEGVAAVRNQTLAIYRFFDDLKRNHPGLEIESCSSGGGRIDLGMAMHADRFWTSDCNDALERLYIQRYTQIAIPPELLGSHIGPTKAHTTGRTHALSFRAVSALFGHAGLEWDVTEATEAELASLKSWAAYYKQNRALIHSGKTIRVDQPDDAVLVSGVVSQDQSSAIFSYATVAAQRASRPNSFRLAGLDASKSYRVQAVMPAGEPLEIARSKPNWLAGVTLSGQALMSIGLRPPILAPEQAFLIEVKVN
jgi:alpha-galactosidase